ncbi:MAG: hypothetical protein QM755_08075 [Luteolibacter sp.]
MSEKFIILFEDDPSERELIASELKAILPNDVSVYAFRGAPASRKGPYETLLLYDLADVLPKTILILCDQDLSRLDGFGGLSANVVTSVAHDRSVPIALYGRGQDNKIFSRMRQKGPFLERRFMLDFDPEKPLAHFAAQVSILFQGCQSILEFMLAAQENSTGQLAGSPAKWLSDLLAVPEIQSGFALYGSGDQQYLQNLAFTNKIDFPDSGRMIACEISYWLWDSILRFPGILACRIASESLLNIEQELLTDPKVAAIFESAFYKGPFAGFGPYWWRHKILELLDQSNVEDGLALVIKILGSTYDSKRSRCCEDQSKPAGAYCMLSELPVSVENSYGDIPYFPAGADLARISTSQFERVAPWAGLDNSY